MPYPLKPVLKLDYCWRLTYTMFKHAFVLAGPLTFIHFIWTEAPGCWNLRLRTLPFKKIFRNYFTCVLLINAVNTFWSLSVEEYW